jgi:hypothetical protein
MESQIKPKTARLFASKIETDCPNGCHEWKASLDSRGYGQFRFGSKIMKAHRFSWMLSTGKDPGAFFVCHECDNPKCVNPAHLFLGTHTDNMKDMHAKGRAPIQTGAWRANNPESVLRGEDAPNVKIAESVVRAILDSTDTGWGCRARLAKVHGITPQHVGRILAGKAWAHVA